MSQTALKNQVGNARLNAIARSLERLSPAERLAALERAHKVLSRLDLLRLEFCWPLHARPNQLPPEGDWSVWLLMAGRGFGKTRAGAEWVRARVESERSSRLALVGRTPSDARRYMIEGESGLLSVCPPWFRPVFEPSKGMLTWPNGATALIFSSYEPDQLRGPQFDAAWCDELASWRYPRETWDNLTFALRLGADPRCVVTTTPKPIATLRRLVARPDVRLTRGSSYDNEVNLTRAFFAAIRSQYEGTAVGRQEIHAELLDQADGALWDRAWIDGSRVDRAPDDLRRVVVAVDPAVSSNPRSDETGIVVAGVDRSDHFYILADRSGRLSPKSWAERTYALYREFEADRVIGETNNGGDLVKEVFRNTALNKLVRFRSVTASRGKIARAEPIAALYEQDRVHHVGIFQDLEDQMCTWTPRSPRRVSPDRMDALVWAVTDLARPRYR